MSATSETAASAVASISRGERLGAVFQAIRPRQWTKNALLLAGLVFAGRVGSGRAWAEATTALVAYCSISSAAYLLNDVHDRAADRLHPVKRHRPIASGTLPVRVAAVLSGGLALAGIALVARLGAASLLLVVGFLGVQSAYTLFLKRVPLVDVLTIAGLFALRASAGAVAIHVNTSKWLLICTALLALFLGLAKRRGELILVEAGRAPGRDALRGYSLRLVDTLVMATAALAVVAYVGYSATARPSREMLLTVPFVVFGVLRYLHLVRARGVGEEPENVLLRDAPILCSVVLWAATAAALLATT
jgi:4-hydroxybenzoate polyprenyltransferase